MTSTRTASQKLFNARPGGYSQEEKGQPAGDSWWLDPDFYGRAKKEQTRIVGAGRVYYAGTTVPEQE